MATTVLDMPREKKPPTETVRIAKDLVRRINRLAAHMDVSAPDWLAEKLRPIIEADEKELLAELQREHGEPKRKK